MKNEKIEVIKMMNDLVEWMKLHKFSNTHQKPKAIVKLFMLDVGLIKLSKGEKVFLNRKCNKCRKDLVQEYNERNYIYTEGKYFCTTCVKKVE